MELTGFLGGLGAWAIGVLLLLLARLSRRLGNVMIARPYYRGLYFCAGLVWIGAFGRWLFALDGLASFRNLNQNTVYVVLCNGAPTIGIMLGLVITWYYWSWLLAERG